MRTSLLPLALLLAVSASHADGLPLTNDRYAGLVIVFELTGAQKKVIDRYRACRVEHPNTMNVYSPYIFKLTSSQAKALTAKKGFSPSRFAVYETYREFNVPLPRRNLVLRFSEDEFEVPLELVSPGHAATAGDDGHVWETFNPCFPELLAP